MASDPAFPFHYRQDGEELVTPGLTKREYVAARILAGVMSDGPMVRAMADPLKAEQAVKAAIAVADALLEELAK